MSRKFIGLILVCCLMAPVALAKGPTTNDLLWVDWLSSAWATWFPEITESNAQTTADPDGSPSIDPTGLQFPDEPHGDSTPCDGSVGHVDASQGRV